jgi:hypothetical protein
MQSRDAGDGIELLLRDGLDLRVVIRRPASEILHDEAIAIERHSHRRHAKNSRSQGLQVGMQSMSESGSCIRSVVFSELIVILSQGRDESNVLYANMLQVVLQGNQLLHLRMRP